MFRSGIALVVLATACGGASPQPAGSPADAPAGAPRDPRTLEGATVYDANGSEVHCEAPGPSCPDMATPREFLDACKMGGYQIRQCGCSEVCTGNVMKEKAFYDADGNPKECVPEDSSCTPPDTSAAFQDACNDAHNKLVVCGCEWLCDGPLKQ